MEVCNHKKILPINEDWLCRDYYYQGMARLKAYCQIIKDYKAESSYMMQCCYYNSQKRKFWYYYDEALKTYELEDIDMDKYRKAYMYALDLMNNNTNINVKNWQDKDD